MSDIPLPVYNTYEATGGVQVMTGDGKVALSVFGSYALLEPSVARLLAQDIYDRSLDVEGVPRD